MTYIAKNLRYLRKLAELSQQSFANKVGLNRGNIASYEKGAAEPNTQNLLKIARYFNIDIIDFVEKDLSELVSEQLLEVKGEGDQVVFDKHLLPDIVNSWQNKREGSIETSSIQVLADRSASLYAIIGGTSEYYRMAREKQEEGSWDKNYDRLYMDFLRSIELTQEVMDINRQLFRLLMEHSNKNGAHAEHFNGTSSST